MKGWQRTELQELFYSSREFLNNLGDKQPWEIREFLSDLPTVLGVVLENQDKYCQRTVMVHKVQRRCLEKLNNDICSIHKFM